MNKIIIKSIIIISAILNIISIYSCGNNSHTNTVSQTPSDTKSAVSLLIKWPKLSKESIRPTKNIPITANSIVVTVTYNPDVIISKIVSKPSDGETSVLKFEGLPVGNLNIRAVAYPNNDGTGVAHAVGDTDVTTQIGETKDVSITMYSIIGSWHVDWGFEDDPSCFDILTLSYNSDGSFLEYEETCYGVSANIPGTWVLNGNKICLDGNLDYGHYYYFIPDGPKLALLSDESAYTRIEGHDSIIGKWENTFGAIIVFKDDSTFIISGNSPEYGSGTYTYNKNSITLSFIITEGSTGIETVFYKIYNNSTLAIFHDDDIFEKY